MVLPIRVVGVDPSGKSLAICYHDHQTDTHTLRKVLAPKGGRLLDVIDQVNEVLLEIASGGAKVYFTCEGQFVRKHTRGSISKAGDIMGLSHARGMIEALAAMNGFDVQPSVQPVSWQCTILKIPSNTGSSKRKTLAKQLATQIMGEQVKDSDLADALCICEYARKRIDMKKALYGKDPGQDPDNQHPGGGEGV